MVGLVSVLNFTSDIASILRNKNFPKYAVLLAYIKLRFLKIFYRGVSKTKIYNINLLGFNLNCSDYSYLLLMFREVFIRSDYFFKTDKKSPFIIDCGANIGISIISFKMLYPGALIMAFEPSRMVFESLRNNIEINKLSNVELINKAVYNTEGTIPFYYDPQNYGSLIMSTEKGRLLKTSEEHVSAVLLSNYIDKPVDFLKMDIEGAEDLIIEELANRGKLSLISEMVIEYHHHIDPNKDNFSGILRTLEDHGFGYQIMSFGSIYRKGGFQDILIHAYRK